MVVEATRGNVRAGEVAKRQCCAVGAASDGARECLDPNALERLVGVVDKSRVGGDLLGHIAVLIANLDEDARLAPALVDEVGDLKQHGLLHLKGLQVVIAYDVVGESLAAVAVDIAEVEKALVTIGVLGTGVLGKHAVEILKHAQRVYHDVLSAARMDFVALDANSGACCIEAFVFHAAEHISVDGIAVGCAKALYIEQTAAVADLLVGCKAHSDTGMAQGSVVHGMCQVAHDFSHAGLVVGAKQRRAVGAHDVLANKL